MHTFHSLGHVFQWFPVHKHINSKKPISFILNSRSATIGPHFPLPLSVPLVGSLFSGLVTCSSACYLCQYPVLVLPGPSLLFSSIDSREGKSPQITFCVGFSLPGAIGLPVQRLLLETWLCSILASISHLHITLVSLSPFPGPTSFLQSFT